MNTITTCSRRDFIKATGLSLTGLVLGFHVSSSTASAQNAVATTGAFEPNAFIIISSAQGVTLSIASPEIGQNIRTAFAMILADELGANLDTVTLHQAPPRGDMGRQVAGGSGSVRKQYLPMREAAATARAMLIAAAAKEWGVSLAQCHTNKSMVWGPDGKQISFEDIALKAAEQPVPSSPELKPAADFDYIGKATRCLDTRAIVTGQTEYGIDAYPDHLAFAVMVRCPVYEGKLSSFDASAAERMPGVKEILQVGDKIAVIANSTWSAINASRAVDVEWENGGHGTADSETKLAEGKRILEQTAEVIYENGDFEGTFAESENKFDEEFFVPMIAHVTMEPPTGTVWFHDGQVEIWGSCQILNKLYADLPKMTGLPHEKITYHQLRIGGGFGRKLANDYLEEAIQIAKAVDYPVKMTFSREDDIHHDRYRIPEHCRFRVGLGKKGEPLAIEQTVTGFLNKKRQKQPSLILRYFQNSVRKYGLVHSGVQSGALRAPGHNITSFMEQSVFDMMAVQADIDSIDYQLALHGDTEQLMKLGWSKAPRNEPIICDLLKKVKAQSDWKKDSNYGYGVATFSGYGSHCALVALVSKNGGTRPVEKVFAAVHCGQVINPLGAHAQIEGGIIDCLSATLYQKITLSEGRIQQSNFHDYKLLRMPEHPEVQVTLAESSDEPQGLGEVAYPPMAAATTNALFDATGRRYTKLPLRG